MFSVEFGKISRIFLISSVSELFSVILQELIFSVYSPPIRLCSVSWLVCTEKCRQPLWPLTKAATKMSNVQSFCAFCHKKNGKLKCFLTNTLKKCLTILRIRKDNRLHSANVVLPAKFDNYNKYHRQCYARFTALPPKQRGYDPKKQASSSSERE